MSDGGQIWLIIICMYALAAFIYFFPAYKAFSRNHPHRKAIFVLNLFLGATGVVWVLALVWAYMDGNDT